MAGLEPQLKKELDVEILDQRGKRTVLKINQNVFTVLKKKSKLPMNTEASNPQDQPYTLVMKLDAAETVASIIQNVCKTQLQSEPPLVTYKPMNCSGHNFGLFDNVKMEAGQSLDGHNEQSSLQVNLIVWKKPGQAEAQFALLDMKLYEDTFKIEDATVVLNKPLWVDTESDSGLKKL